MRIRGTPLLPLALAALLPLGGAAEPPPEPKPRSIGLVEKAGAHLAQLDVTITGPRDTASRLTPADFEVWVGQRRIETFDLDAVCAPLGAEPAPDAPAPRPLNYLFYFDQRHLSPPGRRRALEAARGMVPRLVAGGSRGMVVSSARRLRVFAELTSNPQELLSAIAAVENDPEQNDPSVVQEELRVAEMESTLIRQREEIKVGSDVIKAATAGSDGMDSARQGANALGSNVRWQRLFWDASPGRDGKDAPGDRTQLFNAVNDNAWAELASLARQFERDEDLETADDFKRLASAIAGLAETEPPRIMVYFADTARRNAGAHFGLMFTDRGAIADSGPGELAIGRTRAGLDVAAGTSARSAFDAVLREAASQGVRFYSVQAEGLAPSSTRVRDAQDTLKALALETGGQSFLNGVPAERMAADILGDLSCLYLLSFSPEKLAQDRPLPVRVAVSRPGLAVQVRGQIIVQSESARQASRLAAAFARRGDSEDGTMSAAVIPTGYDGGRYSALVQLAVPSSTVPRGSWEIGATLVQGGSAREIAKRKIATNVTGIPIVLERVERFRSGPYEVVAVARDTSTGAIVTRRIEGEWPEVGKAATIGPIAVLEPVSGAFVRGPENRTSGSLARSETQPLRADHPAAIVSLVCRAEDGPTTIRAERRLVGEEVMRLAPLDLDLRKDLCAQVRDVVPSNTFGAGRFLYEIKAVAEGIELARRDRSFVVFKAHDPVPAP